MFKGDVKSKINIENLRKKRTEYQDIISGLMGKE